MPDDIIICNCNEIYKSTIVKAIREKGLSTVEQVQEETTAVPFVVVVLRTLKVF